MKKYQATPSDVVLYCECGEKFWCADPRDFNTKASKEWNKVFKMFFDLIDVSNEISTHKIKQKRYDGMTRNIDVKAMSGKYRCYKCKNKQYETTNS